MDSAFSALDFSVRACFWIFVVQWPVLVPQSRHSGMLHEHPSSLSALASSLSIVVERTSCSLNTLACVDYPSMFLLNALGSLFDILDCFPCSVSMPCSEPEFTSFLLNLGVMAGTEDQQEKQTDDPKPSKSSWTLLGTDQLVYS